jgi:hypothetical protein
MEYNSLATWIIFYLEQALWIQFKHNVKGEFSKQMDRITMEKTFTAPEEKLINFKNEYRDTWTEIRKRI